MNTFLTKVLLHAPPQNNDGSFGAYELTRSYQWLEVRFDSHLFKKNGLIKGKGRFYVSMHDE
jgi:hypothetical protein